MRHPFTLCALFVACTAALFAQNSSERLLTASELTRRVESLGGEEGTKSPFGLSPSPTAPKSDNIFAASPPGADPADQKKDRSPTKKDKGPTEITSLEANFDAKAHQAIFIGKVVVKDPEFNVTCDKLTAYLKHDEKPAGNPASAQTPAKPANGGGKPSPITPRPAPPSSGEAAPKPGAQKGSGGLERAIAEGSVVITQDKIEADGTVTKYIGRAKKAVYDATTGDIVLTGRPEVQQGMNTSTATDESTVMTMNRDGRMRTVGPSKISIKEQTDKGQ